MAHLVHASCSVSSPDSAALQYFSTQPLSSGGLWAPASQSPLATSHVYNGRRRKHHISIKLVNIPHFRVNTQLIFDMYTVASDPEI